MLLHTSLSFSCGGDCYGNHSYPLSVGQVSYKPLPSSVDSRSSITFIHIYLSLQSSVLLASVSNDPACTTSCLHRTPSVADMFSAFRLSWVKVTTARASLVLKMIRQSLFLRYTSFSQYRNCKYRHQQLLHGITVSNLCFYTIRHNVITSTSQRCRYASSFLGC